MNCTKLEDIDIPQSVHKIGASCFYRCSSLKKMNIPDKITNIEEGVFSNCTSLETVYLSDNISVIGETAFSGCVSLSNINLSNNITRIGLYAFKNCKNLIGIDFPNKVTEIENGVFCGCESLENITIPNSINEIGVDAFLGCTNLKKIIIPSSVIKIGTNAVGYYRNAENENIKINNFSIIGTWGSVAYKYATDNGIKFVENDKPEVFNINYNLDGGTNNPNNPDKYNCNDSTIVLQNPKKDGYRFDGWYMDSNFSQPISQISTNLKQDYTVYAKWTFLYSPDAYQIVLNGNFDFRLYLNLSDEILNDSTSYVRFVLGEKIQNRKPSTKINGNAIYTCEVAAGQLADNIQVQLYYAGEYYDVGNYSVKMYLEKLINNENNVTEYKYAHDLAVALLNYGAYAQQYFKYNINNLANSNISNTNVENLSDEKVKNNIEKEIFGNLSNSNLEYYGVSLICESDTYLRIYFTNKHNLSLKKINEEYNIKIAGIDNSIFEIGEDENLFYITLKDIPAASLDNDFCFYIGNGVDDINLWCSPMIYIKNAMDNSNISLKNLCKALYLYNTEAKKYYYKYSVPI